MSQFSTQIHKLSLDSKDGVIVGDVFSTKTEKGLTDRLGYIFGLIELIDMPDQFIDRFFEIVEDLRTEYYLPPFNLENGLEKRFEECLLRANRRIYKAINESIEKIDLENINCILGLNHRSQLFLSQAGIGLGLLFHLKSKYDYSIVEIFDNHSDKKHKLNQERLFSNIISGGISEKDTLFFSNNSITNYLSKKDLSEIILKEHPQEALLMIEKKLRLANSEEGFYAITIDSNREQKNSQLEKEKAETIYNSKTEHSLNNLIKTQEKTEQFLKPSLMPNWQKAIVIALSYLKKGVIFISIKGYQGLKIAGVKSWGLIKNVLPGHKAKTIPEEVKKEDDIDEIGIEEFLEEMPNRQASEITEANLNNVAPEYPISESIVEAPENIVDLKENNADIIAEDDDDIFIASKYEDTSSEIMNKEEPVAEEVMLSEEEKEFPVEEPIAEIEMIRTEGPKSLKQSLSNTDQKIVIKLNPFKSIIYWLAGAINIFKNGGPAKNLSLRLNQAIQSFINLRRSQQAVLIVIFVLLFLFSQSAVLIGRSQRSSSNINIPEISSQIQELLDSAEAKNVYADEAGSKINLDEAQALLDTIPDSKKFASTKEELQNRINSISESIQKIVNIENPPLVYDLGKNNPDVQPAGLASINSNLFTADKITGNLYQLDTVKKQFKKIVGNAKAKKIENWNDKQLIIYDGLKSVSFFLIGSSSTQPALALSEPLSDFAVYSSRLYALLPGKKQIMKYSPTGNKLNSGAVFYKDQAILKDAVSLAVDIDSYLLLTNGEVVKIVKNEVERRFNISAGKKLGINSQIQTESGSNYLFIFDPTNKRIIVTDRKGSIKLQFVSPALSNATDFTIQEKLKKIFFLSDNKVYSLDIKF